MSAHPAARSRTARRRVALPRVPLRTVLAAVAAVALLIAGWLWLRDSSLVSVDRVQVTGVSGERARAVRAALESAAQDMTTLDVDRGALSDSVARFTTVRSVEATPDFPHTLRIHVNERVPVGAIVSEGGSVAVADDGVLLRDLPTAHLPHVISRVPPSGARVVGRKMQVKVALLAAAPRRMRARIVRVTLGPQGLVAVLASGPKLRFGDGGRLRAKWIAAVRVLSDPAAKTAAYIDLRVPERPAAGGLTVAQGGTQVEPAQLEAPVTTAGAPAATGEAPATTQGTVQAQTVQPQGTGQVQTAQPGAVQPQVAQPGASTQGVTPATTGAAQAP